MPWSARAGQNLPAGPRKCTNAVSHESGYTPHVGTDNPAFDERRHSYCPNCYSVRAQVTSVRWGVTCRMFEYRCPACGLEFSAQLPHDGAQDSDIDDDRADQQSPDGAEPRRKGLAG